jgi:hypothetical protein
LASAFTFATLLAAAPAAAQEIYGRIWESGSNRPMEGAMVQSSCARNESQPAVTDRYGFYRLLVLSTQVECQLSINFEGQWSTPLSVYVASSRTLADIEARRSGASWLLIRR